MGNKYNNIDEFIEEVEEIGLEIEFEYSKKRYSITWSNNKLYIIECQVDDTLREYNNLYEALDDYIIENLPLRDVILKSNILSH